MTIWFDMDGTIANLYGVEGWLDMIQASDPTPYEIAKPLVHLSTLARMLNKLRAKGYEIGVISWLAKFGSTEYNADVTAAKYAWLSKHLPSVDFDSVHIVPYGTPKYVFAEKGDILFDDETPNRAAWWYNGGKAYDVHNIFEILGAL